jgi:hypothetical protein
MFVFADGLRVNLTAKLNVGDTVLPISAGDASKVCAIVGIANFTYLTISNGISIEVVKATCAAGVVNIERAQNGTSALTIPANSCASFVVNKAVVDAYMSQGGQTPAVCKITAGSSRIEITENPLAPCEKIINTPICPGATWKSGNWIYTQTEAGCVTRSADEDCSLDANTYENATITINGQGQICKIESGSNIVHSGGGCCTCQSCTSGCGSNGSGSGSSGGCVLSTSTMVAGQYGPFTVSECGFITKYDASLNNFAATVAPATTSAYGTVTLIDSASPSSNDVITYDYLNGILTAGGFYSICSLPSRVATSAITLAGCKQGEDARFSISDLKPLFTDPVNVCNFADHVDALIEADPTNMPNQRVKPVVLNGFIPVCINGATEKIKIKDLFDAIKVYVA